MEKSDVGTTGSSNDYWGKGSITGNFPVSSSAHGLYCLIQTMLFKNYLNKRHLKMKKQRFQIQNTSCRLYRLFLSTIQIGSFYIPLANDEHLSCEKSCCGIISYNHNNRYLAVVRRWVRDFPILLVR